MHTTTMVENIKRKEELSERHSVRHEYSQVEMPLAEARPSLIPPPPSARASMAGRV